jgi:hypothetical protein
MTQTPAPTALHLLDPATRAVLLHSVYGVLPIPPDASPEQIAAERDAALEFVAALDPGDPIEAMLVARCVAAHYAGLASLHEVMQGDHPTNLHLRFAGNRANGFTYSSRSSTRQRSSVSSRSKPAGSASANFATVPQS